MSILLASSTVLLTILFCLAFGIASGYVAISFILRAFGHKPQQHTATRAAVIITTASSQ